MSHAHKHRCHDHQPAVGLEDEDLLDGLAVCCEFPELEAALVAAATTDHSTNVALLQLVRQVMRESLTDLASNLGVKKGVLAGIFCSGLVVVVVSFLLLCLSDRGTLLGHVALELLLDETFRLDSRVSALCLRALLL